MLRTPVEAKVFLLPETPRPALEPTQPPIQCVLGFFPGVKRARREVDHKPSYSAEVKNEWRYTSTPLICLHGVDRDNFTSYDYNGLLSL